MYNSSNILTKIEFLRKRMAEAALDKGLTSSESIYLSQELDRLLNSYESLQKEEQNNVQINSVRREFIIE